MYTRFYNSIISPRNIVNFRKDALWKVFLYILFFALLLSTRMTIDVITFDGLDDATKQAITDDFNGVNETCVISDGNLECTDKEMTLVYQTIMVTFYTDSFDNWNPSVYQESGYNIVLHGSILHFVVSGQDLYQMPISDLPSGLQNFDFSLYETDQTAFFDIIFDATDEYLISTKTAWGAGMIIFDFLTNLAMFLLFILLSSWMLRMRYREVKFKQLFTMTAYSSTALYIILILNSLYNLSFFLIIILLFVAIRQNSQLSLELHNRLRKKP